MYKQIFLSLLFCLSFWGIARFTHLQTKGFRLSKIERNSSCLPHDFEPPPPQIKNILNQKFRFLGRGIECFAFVSEDEKTVLKLFNNRYQKRLYWLNWIPQIGPLAKWKNSQVLTNQKKWERAFQSYTIACEALHEETGILYFHPKPTLSPLPITLVDNLKIEHSIDLADKAFALQKKATLVYPFLLTCNKNSQDEKARQALFSLVALIKKKMEKGIADRDPLIRTNFGFLDDHAIQIDIGPLSLDPSLKNPPRQKEEIGKITLSLKHWLENQIPQYIPYLNEALETY